MYEHTLLNTNIEVHRITNLAFFCTLFNFEIIIFMELIFRVCNKYEESVAGSGEEVAECIELSTDKMEGGREEEEELEEEDEELSSLSTCCSECTVMKSTCCTMAGWVRQEEDE